MRRTLVSANGQITLLRSSWLMIVRLARLHGWRDPVRAAADRARAENAFPPEPPESVMALGTPGTTIAGIDAAALADVIEHALPDIPDQDALGLKVCSTIDLPGWAVPHVGRRRLRMIRPGAKVSPVEYFSGDNKRRLPRLIRVLRGGEVEVRAIERAE
ncbi:MAG: hypothetical protein ACKVS8_12800 [Phycisphaerales bacterium]